MPHDERAVADIGGRIQRYLNEHPDAADTADGIRDWWLASTLVARPALDAVQAALDTLVTRGLVARRDRPGMPPIYRQARRNKE